MDIFVKRSINNFKGLTSCNVTFVVNGKNVRKKLRFYFSHIKKDDIFYIISLDFISMDKINDWSKVESLGEEAVVNAINESISEQLSFFVAYYKDNFADKKKLSAINRSISIELNIFYAYIKLKSKISRSIKKLSNNTQHQIGENNYSHMYGSITYMEI